MAAHTFYPNTWDAGPRISEFPTSLVYRVIARTARVMYKGTVSKPKQKSYQM